MCCPGQAINGYADHAMVLKRIKQTVKNACVGPTMHSGVNLVPLAETWRLGPPFTAIFGDKKDGIDHSKVRNPHIAALNRQIGLDWHVLIIYYLNYNIYLAQLPVRR